MDSVHLIFARYVATFHSEQLYVSATAWTDECDNERYPGAVVGLHRTVPKLGMALHGDL